MAFNGLVIQVGTYRIPLKYVQLESYAITPNQRQDLDSYRDANGVLQRTVLEHTATKIEFETPYMHLRDKLSFMSNLKAQFNNINERKVSVTYYDDETDSYKSGTFYIPDIQWTYYNVDEDNADIIYAPTRIAFIEY